MWPLDKFKSSLFSIDLYWTHSTSVMSTPQLIVFCLVVVKSENICKSNEVITFLLSLRRTGVKDSLMVLGKKTQQNNKISGVMKSLGAGSHLRSHPCAGSQWPWPALFIRHTGFLLLIKDFKTLTLTACPSVLRRVQPPFLYSERVHPEATTCFIWSCVVASLESGTFSCGLSTELSVSGFIWVIDGEIWV